MHRTNITEVIQEYLTDNLPKGLRVIAGVPYKQLLVLNGKQVTFVVEQTDNKVFAYCSIVAGYGHNHQITPSSVNIDLNDPHSLDMLIKFLSNPIYQ